MATSEDSVTQVVPLTPMRKFLCRYQLIRPVIALGKRHRDASPEPYDLPETASDARGDGDAESCSEEFINSKATGPGVVATGSPVKYVRRARVALQQDDAPLDAIVITTLPCYPFCCHEDLITMSRPQLVEVAALFNAHLPQTIQIEVSDTVSDAHIRRVIESLVGIIPSTPSAPKAVRSRPIVRSGYTMPEMSDETTFDVLPSPPTSPLAMRVSRRRGPSNNGSTTRLLECLEEVDEEDMFIDPRPLKRRKVSDIPETPTRSPRDRDDMDTDAVSGRALTFSTSVEMFYPTTTPSTSPDMGMVISSPIEKPETSSEKRLTGQGLRRTRRSPGQLQSEVSIYATEFSIAARMDLT